MEGSLYKGFKLISLNLSGVKMFGDIEFNFVDSFDKQDKIYTTVIIGPNGTRKSLLFNLIIFIFNSIYNLKSGKLIKYEEYSKYSSGFYQIKYSLNNSVYQFERNSISLTKGEKFGYSCSIDGERVDIEQFHLPLAIIANSISIRDKFPFINRSDFPLYSYLGVKSSPQTASTQAYLRKIVDFVAEHSVNGAFINGLKMIAEKFIGEGKSICLTYRTSQHKKFFSKSSTFDRLEKYFLDIEERFQKSGKRPPNKLANFNKLKQDKVVIEELIEFCKSLDSKNFVFQGKGQSNRTVKFNLSDKEGLSNLKSYNEKIKQLYSIGLLTDIKIEFHDILYGNYNLEESSSGEYNLITSFIGFMATIKKDSLLLIDEPEISLHPNWQMKFISFFKEIFSHPEYINCHVIIASHSHFIVSDMEMESSKLIGLSKTNNLEVVSFEKQLDTFGWSAEEVLLKIFNVTTSRNYYVAEKLGLLLDFIADENSNKDSIRAKFYELELNKITGLTDEDPLKTVFDKIITEYVS